MRRSDVVAFVNELRSRPYDECEGLVDELAAMAERVGDDDLRFEASLQRVVTYLRSGWPAPSRAREPFRFLVASLDRRPPWLIHARVTMAMPLFKDVLRACLEDPRVSRAEITGLLAAMERSYRGYRTPPSTLALARWLVAWGLDGAQAATPYYEAWLGFPRDALSDCQCCERGLRMEFLTALGHPVAAASFASPAGEHELVCRRQPQSRCAHSILPLLCAGRPVEAVDAHLAGLRLRSDQRLSLGDLALHVESLARAGQPRRALQLTARSAGVRARSDGESLAWAAACAAACRSARASGIQEPLRFEAESLAPRAGEERAWHRALELACRFDDRNGNEHVTASIRARLQACPVPALPLAGGSPPSGWRPPDLRWIEDLDVGQPEVVERQVREMRLYGNDLSASALLRRWAGAGVTASTPDALAAASALDLLAAKDIAAHQDNDALVDELRSRAEERAFDCLDPAVRRAVAVGSLSLDQRRGDDIEVALSRFGGAAKELGSESQFRLLRGFRDVALDRAQLRRLLRETTQLPVSDPLDRTQQTHDRMALHLLNDDAADADELLAGARREGMPGLEALLLMRASMRGVSPQRETALLGEAVAMAAARPEAVRSWCAVVVHLTEDCDAEVAVPFIPQTVELVNRLWESGEVAVARHASLQLAATMLHRDRCLEALDLVEQVLATPRAASLPSLRSEFDDDTVRAEAVAVFLLSQRGESERAARYARSLLERREQFQFDTSHLWNALAVDAESHERAQEALSSGRLGFEAAVAEPHWFCALSTSGIVAWARGVLDGPEAAVREVQAMHERLVDAFPERSRWFIEGLRCVRVGTLYQQAGLFSQSVDAFEESVRAFCSGGEYDHAAEAACDLASAHLAAGWDPEPAYRWALQIASYGRPEDRASVVAHYGEWLRDAGRQGEADAL